MGLMLFCSHVGPEQYRCTFFHTNVIPYRERPVYVLQTTNDAWQVQEMACNTQDPAVIKDLDEAVRQTVRDIRQSKANFGWVGYIYAFR